MLLVSETIKKYDSVVTKAFLTILEQHEVYLLDRNTTAKKHYSKDLEKLQPKRQLCRKKANKLGE